MRYARRQRLYSSPGKVGRGQSESTDTEAGLKYPSQGKGPGLAGRGFQLGARRFESEVIGICEEAMPSARSSSEDSACSWRIVACGKAEGRRPGNLGGLAILKAGKMLRNRIKHLVKPCEKDLGWPRVVSVSFQPLDQSRLVYYPLRRLLYVTSCLRKLLA
jgi:hypothetical protein